MLNNNRIEIKQIVSGLRSAISFVTCIKFSPDAYKLYRSMTLKIQYAADPHEIASRIILFLYYTLTTCHIRKIC